MADGNIKLYGKLKSVTEEGKVADYSEIAGVPIIMQDLNASGFTPTANTYYLHIGETTIMCNKGTIYFYNGTEYKVLGSGGLSDDFGLTQGDTRYSIVQKRIKSDGSTVTSKAYQRGTVAFGGNTVAGDKDGTATDYSFAFAANEDNKAIARSSAAFGRYNTTHNIGEFVCGDYADNNRDPNTVFAVGTGYSDTRRRTGFEVRKNGTYINGEVVASKKWVENNAVKREGTSYVAYINEGDGKSAVMPYRFSKKSILDAEYTLMLQPMYNGRLYGRNPTEPEHYATKEYTDTKLDKPTTPTETSVITLTSAGTVGAKTVSSFVDTTSEQKITGNKIFLDKHLTFMNTTNDKLVQYDVSCVVSMRKGKYCTMVYPALSGTNYFSLTPDAAPTEPSVVVNAVDRTPTWKPLSEFATTTMTPTTIPWSNLKTSGGVVDQVRTVMTGVYEHSLYLRFIYNSWNAEVFVTLLANTDTEITDYTGITSILGTTFYYEASGVITNPAGDDKYSVGYIQNISHNGLKVMIPN